MGPPVRILAVHGFDERGEPEIRVMSDGSLVLAFQFMPPMRDTDDGVEDPRFERFEEILAEALSMPVEREDRELFRIAEPEADTAERAKAFLEAFWLQPVESQARASAPTFVADEKIAKIAAAYALDAVDIAASNFKTKLDGTEDSIALVEDVLGKLHRTLAEAKPPEQAIWNFAKAFGSYLGEVFRKHHGGEWGMVTYGGESFPGIRWKEGRDLFWPWARAHKRIVAGEEENVWDYYRVIARSPAAKPGT
jgi:hypothetical protein